VLCQFASDFLTNSENLFSVPVPALTYYNDARSIMTASATPTPLSVQDLLTKGYFPDRIIPPVNSQNLASAIPDMLAHVGPRAADIINKVKNARLPLSQCVTHSVPKRKHLRRTLSIPHPFHQTILSDEIASNWPGLESFCSQSTISLSIPTQGDDRALVPRNALRKQPFFRTQRSIGARYLLKTDIARYYPSIYTHSVPWALYGKKAAKLNRKYSLLGNRLDLWLRETQNQQTGGIPIGPDTSFLIGEIIGSAMDKRLLSILPNLKGTRSIDDYFLYFPTMSETEKGLAAFHEVQREFELEISAPKTEIVSLPESLEPRWKTELRTLKIRATGSRQATDVLTLFDRAFDHAKNYPSDSVLTYAAKKILGSPIAPVNWSFCEALLLNAAIVEPTMLSVVAAIYDKNPAYQVSTSALASTIESICAYHAPLQQGNEVAWALWLAKKLDISISRPVGELIAKMEDDVVSLIALDLNSTGLLDAPVFSKWREYLTSANLYENHWLLAYEAHEQGWLPSKSGNDYIGTDPFFSILRTHGVRFYGASLAPTASYFEYGEEDNLDRFRTEEDDQGIDLDFPDESDGI